MTFKEIITELRKAAELMLETHDICLCDDIDNPVIDSRHKCFNCHLNQSIAHLDTLEKEAEAIAAALEQVDLALGGVRHKIHEQTIKALADYRKDK